MTYNFILVAAAVIPAVFLMVKVYQSDRLERESPAMLWLLVKAGIFAALIAMVEERVLSTLLGFFLPPSAALYQVILYFGIVAFSEESSKYLMLKRNSWLSPEFNCQYDGVVYAVFTSLGFALWENISYVMNYGLSTAVVRALTAIPGPACFGVFMGWRRGPKTGDSSTPPGSAGCLRWWCPRCCTAHTTTLQPRRTFPPAGASSSLSSCCSSLLTAWSAGPPPKTGISAEPPTSL